ncbi:heat-inducible transcription repressor HrcA [Halanaerobium saccharolyticum]|uniref:Heat-inducible transcription repressor HrcA n=1 Tax=Halanaerobium saccharolyticum TaxID=43595 RepID=A0A4R7Z742_9FIRM|nr:heat-inducible transcriptional repressor HrcA [Halanaerobium saccharolyticum]RAK10332.1 heat-inducible transcription repressor HrcA [Halanaerobium saccharolyticum]TDW05278.1 heat-inducible transcription repressor HrcA [Halanaerobium saccharolyticum]TDX60348.1 heat-inducible transcription repressor HrcA [Halanaerobium saccharolyticum]
MMVEELDSRKKRILQAIIQEHIISASPIGSRTLAKKYNLDVSPATIRNEMADLEDLGYLEQPHTSAGRIPSDKGYRYYVDQLISRKKNEVPGIIENVENLYQDLQDVQDIISGMAKMLSNMTHYTAMVSEPKSQVSRLKKVEIMQLADNSLLLVLVTDTGMVNNKIINLDQSLSTAKISYLNKFLSEKLENKLLANLDSSYLKEVEKELLARVDLSVDLFKQFYNEFEGAFEPGGVKVYLGGTSYILEQPEFNDLEKVKKMLKLLDQEEMLNKIINSISGSDLEIKIGQENEVEDIKNCSLVVATYYISERAVGKIGVIGPTRMEYPRVISSVDVISDILSKLISKASG